MTDIKKWESFAKKNLGRISYSKLSDREKNLLKRFFNAMKVGITSVYDYGSGRQKRDLRIWFDKNNNSIRLDSEYAGTGNGYYYIIYKNKKLLVDID